MAVAAPDFTPVYCQPFCLLVAEVKEVGSVSSNGRPNTRVNSLDDGFKNRVPSAMSFPLSEV